MENQSEKHPNKTSGHFNSLSNDISNQDPLRKFLGRAKIQPTDNTWQLLQLAAYLSNKKQDKSKHGWITTTVLLIALVEFGAKSKVATQDWEEQNAASFEQKRKSSGVEEVQFHDNSLMTWEMRTAVWFAETIEALGKEKYLQLQKSYFVAAGPLVPELSSIPESRTEHISTNIKNILSSADKLHSDFFADEFKGLPLAAVIGAILTMDDSPSRDRVEKRTGISWRELQQQYLQRAIDSDLQHENLWRQMAEKAGINNLQKKTGLDTARAEKPIKERNADHSPDNTGANPIHTRYSVNPEPVITREIIRIREQYRAPPVGKRLTLSITPGEIELNFADKHYYSSMELPEEELLALNLQPAEYGEALFRAVINDTRKRLPRQSTQFGYNTAMDALQNTPEEKIRFEIKIPPELEYINWERLLDPDPAQPPFSTNERLPFYRRVDNKEIQPVGAPLQVLVAICSPAALGRPDSGLLERLPSLQVAEERQSFRLGLEPLQQAGLADYRILGRDDGKPVTLKMLTDAVRQGTHVVHLLAHGLFIDDEYYIVMEHEDSDRPLILASELAQMLKGTGAPLRLAILTACESGSSVPERGTGAALGGILVRSGFPAVISMQKKLGLRTAQVFNQRFYFHLARSGQVEAALAATRFDLRQGKVDLGDGWSIPMLHLGARTGKLFDVDEDRASRLEDTTPQLLSDAELRHIDRSGTDHLRKALQDDALTAALSEEQLAAISRTARATLGEPPAAGGSSVLAAAQNIARLQRQMPQLVDMQARELQDAVAAATRLKLPLAVFEQIASAINAGKHIVLTGPPGTGKTSLAHAICDYATDYGFSTGKIPTTASADWTTFDTIGGYVPTSTQRLEFRPGIFLRAISSGRWLVIDEINRAEIDKAIGELFTVLSGQQVDLPYRVAGHAVRILPFEHRDTTNWVPQQARPHEYDYVVHPNWRILATMNIYDKSSLFGMSFAFMRRFAFVDVGVPDNADYTNLRAQWIDRERDRLRKPFANDDDFTAACDDLVQRFNTLLDQNSPIMRYRELGPAIAKDMIAYIGDRAAQHQQPPLLPELLAEAFLLYAVPQMDGLSREIVTALYCQLKGDTFAGLDVGVKVLDRIEALYPHIPDDDWKTAFEQWQQHHPSTD